MNLHTCFILSSRKQRKNRRPDLCHCVISTLENNLLQVTFLGVLNTKEQMTPPPLSSSACETCCWF